MTDPLDSSPLIPPPSSVVTEIDLEAAFTEQIQCRIFLETRRDFIASCKCKGTSKYAHRECLDHWRAVKNLLLDPVFTSSRVSRSKAEEKRGIWVVDLET
ncbi:hypothetical protein RJT34_16717 [Clitoria ternatea]|uniref:RING-CH-type domain-containing protein n=1 Tax=Clitoria ternatea TaxID=43366 RepID=A0AAN9PD32_CLITE